jgi:hypothetical protein
MRDVGIFLLGVAAVGMTAHYVHLLHFSAEARMRRSIEESFAQAFEKSLAEQSKR